MYCLHLRGIGANHSAHESSLSFVPEFTALWWIIGGYLFSMQISFQLLGASAVMVWNQRRRNSIHRHTLLLTYSYAQLKIFFWNSKSSKHLKTSQRLYTSQLKGKACHSVCACRESNWYSDHIFTKKTFKIIKRRKVPNIFYFHCSQYLSTVLTGHFIGCTCSTAC